MFALIMAIENEEDREKAAALYKLYCGTMLYIANSILKEPHLAEDAVSKAFLKIIHNLEKIKTIDCYQTRGFVVIIVRNTAYDILRQRNRNKTIPFEEYMVSSISEEPVLDKVSAREACNKIAECITKLNKNYSDILYLKIEMDYSYDEIGEILGISRENAKMRMSRAGKALKKLLRKEGDFVD